MKNESNDNENTPVSGENETLTRFESTTESEERWLPIPGYEGHYEVSDLGRVRSLWFGRTKLIKPYLSTTGYYTVFLSNDDGSKRYKLHRLVLLAFVGPPFLGDYHACHNDNNKTNNSLSNLRWDTRKGNFADKKKHGTENDYKGFKHPQVKMTENKIREIRAEILKGKSTRCIAKELGVGRTTVQMIGNGKRWSEVK